MSTSLAGGYQHVATADEHELTPSGSPSLRPYSAAQDSEFNPYNPDNERLDTVRERIFKLVAKSC